MTAPSENGSNGRNELDRCSVCEHTRLWHDSNETRHVFSDDSQPPSATFGKRGSDGVRRGSPSPQRGSEPAGTRPPEMQSRWPFDPVLRQALIDAGLITPQMLIDAEAKIRAITASFESQVNPT